MAKVFYTEQDIDDLHARGVKSIALTENVVITDLGVERAMRHGMTINRAEHSAPKATMSGSVNLIAAYPRTESAGDDELKQKIKSAVLSKLDGQVDTAILEAVISRVVSSLK